jgi:hypothetical protein
VRCVPERLFLFMQFEFPWELGPADGRYLLRAPGTGEPERVIVLNTLGGASSDAAGRGWKRRRRARTVPPQEQPEAAPTRTARATVVDPVPLSAERQARAWLAELDVEREALAAAGVLNRVLYFHRIACADPYVHELSPAQALVIRAGWGEGEQVASGRWLHARELPWGTVPRGRWPGGRARSAALRPGERLAALLGARTAPLLCEELALRARLDLDEDRVAHAALELDAAYEAGLRELRAEEREDLATRIEELEGLREGVATQAQAVRAGAAQSAEKEVVRHALMRLEAALRARTAWG